MSISVTIRIAQLALLGGDKLFPTFAPPNKVYYSPKKNSDQQTSLKYFQKNLQIPEISVIQEDLHNETSDAHLKLHYYPKKFFRIPIKIYIDALKAEGLPVTLEKNNIITLPFVYGSTNYKKYIDRYVAVFKKVHDNYQELL